MLHEVRTQEQLLWAAVALQAVAEQNVDNVRYADGNETGGPKSSRAGFKDAQKVKVAMEAREFVRSSDFPFLCDLAGVDSKSIQSMKPAMAQVALDRLRKNMTVQERTHAKIEDDRSVLADAASDGDWTADGVDLQDDVQVYYDAA